MADLSWTATLRNGRVVVAEASRCPWPGDDYVVTVHGRTYRETAEGPGNAEAMAYRLAGAGSYVVEWVVTGAPTRAELLAISAAAVELFDATGGPRCERLEQYQERIDVARDALRLALSGKGGA
jgi:hypothetical protein